MELAIDESPLPSKPLIPHIVIPLANNSHGHEIDTYQKNFTKINREAIDAIIHIVT
jgi:hypothetical protein